MSFATAPAAHGAAEVIVCRTGYTGEHGYELRAAPGRRGRALGRAARRRAGLGVRPCGLGARDTLRTEMGYPLHGQDLSLDITPVQARAGWAVGWDEAGVLGPRGAARREGGRAAPAAVGAAGDRTAASRGRRMPRRSVPTARGRRGHQRHVLADPAQRHRAGAARPRGRRGRRGRRSTCAAGRRRCRVVKPPFVDASARVSPCRRVLLVGMMGAGKSTIGRALSGATGWPYVDNDAVVTRATGLTVRVLLEQHGEAALRR